MKRKGGLLLFVIGCVLAPSPRRLPAAPVRWPVEEGGNGHAYEFVAAPRLLWEDALAAAAASRFKGVPGHLATVTSPAEWQFIVQRSGFAAVSWGAWVGGRQVDGAPAPDQGWYWITGEPFDFAPWGISNPAWPEPNDNPATGVGEEGLENYLSMIGRFFSSRQDGMWNFGRFNDEEPNPVMDGYVVEFPVPEPAALSLLAAAACAGLCRRQPRRTAARARTAVP